MHTTLTTIRCQFCLNEINLIDVEMHMFNVHNIGIFDCIHCTYSSNDVQNIRQHMANLHSNELLVICYRDKLVCVCLFFFREEKKNLFLHLFFYRILRNFLALAYQYRMI